jgi:hypothetical protein
LWSSDLLQALADLQQPVSSDTSLEYCGPCSLPLSRVNATAQIMGYGGLYLPLYVKEEWPDITGDIGGDIGGDVTGDIAGDIGLEKEALGRIPDPPEPKHAGRR